MFQFFRAASLVPFVVLSGCGGGSVGGGGGDGGYADCRGDEVQDCGGYCEYADYLGDGECDSSLNCADHQYDNGDCSDGGGGDGGGTGGGDGGGTGGDTGGGTGGGDDCGSDTATAFSFLVVSATVPAQQSDGTSWDADGSYPDPMVCFGPEDNYGCTEAASDTLGASYGEYADITVLSEMYLHVYDEDWTDDDFMAGWTISLTQLRGAAGCGNQTAEGDGYSVVFSVTVI